MKLFSKAVPDREMLPKAFAYMKVSENLGTMFTTYLAGYIRVQTNGFIAVHCLFTTISCFTLGISFIYCQIKIRALRNTYTKL